MTSFGLVVGHDPATTELQMVILDLALPGALDDIARWRRDRPQMVIAAHLAVPDRSMWEEAERAGADLVVSRGSLVRSLRALLEGLGSSGVSRRRFPLFDAAEIGGRLGLIRAVEDTPVGPVAVFHTDSGPACVADVCPHAGARLSQGPYEGGVVTCPGHGSQFVVSSGERIRGPADCGVAAYTVAVQDGRLWLLWSGP